MNCLTTALTVLKAIGIVLVTIPSIVVTPDYGRGFYRTYSKGVAVVYVRDVNDCYAMTHELVHHWQYQVVGRMPANRSENYLAETEASRLTQYAMANVDNYGDDKE